MLYALICTDKPNSLAIRKAKRPEHVAYLKSLGDTLKLAGPFTEADGETMNGSLVVDRGSVAAGGKGDRRRRSLRQSRAVRLGRDPPLDLDPQQPKPVSLVQ